MRWLAICLTICACARHTRRAAPPLDAGVSDEDCVRAMANLQRVMPEGLAVDAEELGYCKKMPRQVVLCLETVRAPTEADECVRRYATRAPGFKPVGPNEHAEPIDKEPAASADDCRRVLDHVTQLGFTGGDALLARCVRTATPADITCLSAAKSVDDVRRCGYSEDK